ncbi:hypothetical protein ES708_00713 [subsurface metagenome]
MNGKVAKRLRRENGDQEIAHLRKYVRRENGVIVLHPSMSRIGYQMDKREYRTQRL